MEFKEFGLNAYGLSLDGYWLARNCGVMPHCAGIYFVYVCRYNSQSNTVILRRLLYIGQACDVHDRLANHEKMNMWHRYCGLGETICFSMAVVPTLRLDVCESALIRRHQPPCNTEYRNYFPHRPTTIRLSGDTALLDTEFRVAS